MNYISLANKIEKSKKTLKMEPLITFILFKFKKNLAIHNKKEKKTVNFYLSTKIN